MPRIAALPLSLSLSLPVSLSLSLSVSLSLRLSVCLSVCVLMSALSWVGLALKITAMKNHGNNTFLCSDEGVVSQHPVRDRP